MNCFSDASFNPTTKLAVLAWYIPNLDILDSRVVFTTGPAQAEKEAAKEVLQCCRIYNKSCILHLYTDHEASRKCLPEWQQNYGPLEFHWIKGHTKQAEKTPQHVDFTKVDRLCRFKLRAMSK